MGRTDVSYGELGVDPSSRVPNVGGYSSEICQKGGTRKDDRVL